MPASPADRFPAAEARCRDREIGASQQRSSAPEPPWDQDDWEDAALFLFESVTYDFDHRN
jgi:hypothetical protein